MSEVRKSKWTIILAWKSFVMLGEPVTQAEAEYAARLIWPYLMGVE